MFATWALECALPAGDEALMEQVGSVVGKRASSAIEGHTGSISRAFSIQWLAVVSQGWVRLADKPLIGPRSSCLRRQAGTPNIAATAVGYPQTGDFTCRLGYEVLIRAIINQTKQPGSEPWAPT